MGVVDQGISTVHPRGTDPENSLKRGETGFWIEKVGTKRKGGVRLLQERRTGCAKGDHGIWGRRHMEVGGGKSLGWGDNVEKQTQGEGVERGGRRRGTNEKTSLTIACLRGSSSGYKRSRILK